jgi:hypothetical protein
MRYTQEQWRTEAGKILRATYVPAHQAEAAAEHLWPLVEAIQGPNVVPPADEKPQETAAPKQPDKAKPKDE